MGNRQSVRHNPESWNRPDVKEWCDRARQQQLSFYMSFGDISWHDFGKEPDKEMVIVKICYAIFGGDVHGDLETNIKDAYSEEQKKQADPIYHLLLKEYEKSQAPSFRFRAIFVICKDGDQEFNIPVFAVSCAPDDNKTGAQRFVDMSGRVYVDWNDWKKHNTLPQMKYCHPAHGKYSCTREAFDFDPDLPPLVEFDVSPACDNIALLGQKLDVASTVGSLGSAGAGVACLLMPALIPFVALPSAVVGISSAVYGTGRAIQRLSDKGRHEQSMTDFESITCWLMIISTPFHFANAAATSYLANGARSGRVFTQTIRSACTFISVSTFAADSALLTMGFVNLLEKKKRDELTTLDILQMSVSVFFFTHTLIQPKTASGIINKAQQDHIAAYGKDNIQSNKAQKTYQKFLDQNKGDTMKGRAQIIKTINRIDHPENFFNVASKADSIMIGGRKGKTVIINGKTRINPNLAAKYRGKEMFTRGAFGTPIDGKDVIARQHVQKAFGAKNGQDLKNVKINGKALFNNIDSKDSARLVSVLRQNHIKSDPTIVQTAVNISRSLEVKNMNDFCAVLELVAVEVKGLNGTAKLEILANITGAGQQQFVQQIQNDIQMANKLSADGIKFNSDLSAVYHYRKHGPEFSAKPEFYFKDIPTELFRDEHLISNYVAKDGTTIVKNYYHDGKFGALQQDSQTGNTQIATIFKNPALAEHLPSSEQMHELLTMASKSMDPNSVFKDMAMFF